MDRIADPAAEPPADPEVEALLAFTPVGRRNKRHDGWPPERQRGFIAALARLGNVDRAAHTVDRTASGAWKVRTSAGAEEFADAWDKALALWHERNPRPERIGRPSRGERIAAAAAASRPPEGWVDPSIHYLTPREFADGILRKYRLKLGQEREARLAGRIAEADFYVRQLTWLEVVLDLGGNAIELLEDLKRGNVKAANIVATPMTLLLDAARRVYWNEEDEPERPPLPLLGDHDGAIATGQRRHYSSDHDGDFIDWCRRQDETEALATQAQRAWEEKARAEAQAWAKRSTESRTSDA